MNSPEKPAEQPSFADLAAREGQRSLLRQVFDAVREHKKYWLVPVIVLCLLLGGLLALSATAAGPLVYTLF